MILSFNQEKPQFGIISNALRNILEIEKTDPQEIFIPVPSNKNIRLNGKKVFCYRQGHPVFFHPLVSKNPILYIMNQNVTVEFLEKNSMLPFITFDKKISPSMGKSGEYKKEETFIVLLKKEEFIPLRYMDKIQIGNMHKKQEKGSKFIGNLEKRIMISRSKMNIKSDLDPETINALFIQAVNFSIDKEHYQRYKLFVELYRELGTEEFISPMLSRETLETVDFFGHRMDMSKGITYVV